MAKLTLSDLSNLENQSSAVSTINANNTLIENALELTLSRDGTTPNVMVADLDMNSHNILNLPDPVSPHDPVTFSYAETHYSNQNVSAAAASATAAASSASAAAASASAAAASAVAAANTVGNGSLSGMSNHGVVLATGANTATSTAALTDGQLVVGQTGATPLPKTITGDVTISAAGVTSLSTAARSSGSSNATLVESHAASAATFTVKTLAGATPSASDPVIFVFRDASGAFYTRTLTAALSLTIASTKTLGTSSNISFRLWHVIIDDGGTLRLGVRNCSDANGIYGFPSFGFLSATATPANSAGVTYSDAAVSTKAFSILAISDYDSGQVTAGTWAASPTRTTLYAPGMPLPGQVLQTIRTRTSTNTNNATTAYVDTALTGSIQLSSPINQVAGMWHGTLTNENNSGSAIAAMRRGGTVIGESIASYSAVLAEVAAAAFFIDVPGSTSLQTYTVAIKNAAGGAICDFPTPAAGGSGGAMVLSEIVG